MTFLQVVFNNESPRFTEYGPYSYPEYDIGDEITYSTTTNPLTNVTGFSVNIANA